MYQLQNAIMLSMFLTEFIVCMCVHVCTCVSMCVCVVLIPTDTLNDPSYFSSITPQQGKKTQAV